MDAGAGWSGTAIEALLDWYAAAGVTVALGDAPVDRFEESRLEAEARRARPPATAPQSASRPARTEQQVRLPVERQRQESPPQPVARPAMTAAVPSGDEVAAARSAAAASATLEDLQQALMQFAGCNLKQTAKSLVFAEGNPAARVMFVGDAPGREEDDAGRLFVGTQGELLDRMLAAIGLDRTSVYIANIVPWRPPGNRAPTPQEIEICRPFALRQIELAHPEMLVIWGVAAASSLTGAADRLSKLRGRWLECEAGASRIRAMVTLHPDSLLRQPLQKRHAWRDLLTLKKALDGKLSE